MGVNREYSQLICVDGLPGSGKATLANGLSAYLASRGIANVVIVRRDILRSIAYLVFSQFNVTTDMHVRAKARDRALRVKPQELGGLIERYNLRLVQGKPVYNGQVVAAEGRTSARDIGQQFSNTRWIHELVMKMIREHAQVELAAGKWVVVAGVGACSSNALAALNVQLEVGATRASSRLGQGVPVASVLDRTDAEALLGVGPPSDAMIRLQPIDTTAMKPGQVLAQVIKPLDVILSLYEAGEEGT